MNEIYASKNNVLNIGFMGEDNRTRVHFPVGDLQAEYPGCSFVLLIKRAGDNSVYVVEPVISGDEALWTVEDGFLANKGEGEAVLICSTGTVTAKRKAWKTWTDYSLSGGVTPPADFSTWVTELLQAGADVQAAVDAFNEITAEATEGEQTSAYIDRTGDHPVLRIVIRSGGGAVSSVNGKTGTVVLGASDVHALPDSTSIPVVDSDLSGTSTNAIQNKVVKNALDQKADSTTVSQLSETIVQLSGTVSGKYAKPSGGIPSTDMSEAVQISLGKADTALQESDIHSTLTKIFDVTLEEEAALIVTEINEVPLSVDELHLCIFCPSGNALSTATVNFHSGTKQIGQLYHGTRTDTATQQYWFGCIKKDGGVWRCELSTSQFGANNFMAVNRYWTGFYTNNVNESCIEYPKITKVTIPAHPAGTRIALYAR